MSNCIKQLIKIYSKIKKTKTSYKSVVWLKVVRAKLTCTWERGGIRGKKLTESNLSATKMQLMCNIDATYIQLKCNLNAN